MSSSLPPPPPEDPSALSEPSGTRDDDDDEPRILRKLRRIVLLPYVVGILWTCSHPVLSVLTGESKCRGWFIDENSLDGNFVGHESNRIPSYLSAATSMRRLGYDSVCDYFHPLRLDPSRLGVVQCSKDHPQFDILTVTPASGAVQPVEEAVVIVLPSPSKHSDWSTSLFHFKFLKLIEHIADPEQSPWLAKTIHVVTPKTSSSSSMTTHKASALESDRARCTDSILRSTVEAFLDAHSGIVSSYPQTSRNDTDPCTPNQHPFRPLPAHLTKAVIRNLLVLDARIVNNEYRHLASRTSNRLESRPFAQIQVLPQGQHGVLPNMDLVFAVGKSFARSAAMQPRTYPRSIMVPHPHLDVHKRVRRFLGTEPFAENLKVLDDPTSNRRLLQWADDFVGLALFAYTMAVGPYPPHAPALQYGIDSLTVRAVFHGNDFTRAPVEEYLEYTGKIIRSLSNLHERLHHSETLYLLPTSRKFVSHMEYFLPCLLLLIPLVIRSVHVLVQNLRAGVHLQALGCWWVLGVGSPILVQFLAGPSTRTSAIALLCLYAAIAAWLLKAATNRVGSDNVRDRTEPTDAYRMISTLHLCSCITAIYIHAPIAFAHIAIAYPSAILWVPLLVAGPTVPRNSAQLTLLQQAVGLTYWAAAAFATSPSHGWWRTAVPHFYRIYVLTPLHANMFCLFAAYLVTVITMSKQPKV